jgi:hypothetical protein
MSGPNLWTSAKPRLSVVGLAHVEPIGVEVGPDELTDLRFVVDDQNPGWSHCVNLRSDRGAPPRPFVHAVEVGRQIGRGHRAPDTVSGAPRPAHPPGAEISAVAAVVVSIAVIGVTGM